MARMEFSGTQELMDELFAESERLERKATEMLGEAGKVVVDAWKQAITDAGHAPPGKSRRATGDLLNSVRASAVKKNGDAYTSTIYPHGRDRRKQGMADIAFVLHYGTSKIKGDHFVDDAEAKAEEATYAVMEQVWNRD
jgi:hypothetical protein